MEHPRARLSVLRASIVLKEPSTATRIHAQKVDTLQIRLMWALQLRLIVLCVRLALIAMNWLKLRLVGLAPMAMFAMLALQQRPASTTTSAPCITTV